MIPAESPPTGRWIRCPKSLNEAFETGDLGNAHGRRLHDVPRCRVSRRAQRVGELRAREHVERRHARRRPVDPLAFGDDVALSLEDVVPERGRPRDVEPSVALNEQRVPRCGAGGRRNEQLCGQTLSENIVFQAECARVAARGPGEVDRPLGPRILDHAQHQRVGAHQHAELQTSRIDGDMQTVRDRTASVVADRSNPGRVDVGKM